MRGRNEIQRAYLSRIATEEVTSLQLAAFIACIDAFPRTARKCARGVPAHRNVPAQAGTSRIRLRRHTPGRPSLCRRGYRHSELVCFSPWPGGWAGPKLERVEFPAGSSSLLSISGRIGGLTEGMRAGPQGTRNSAPDNFGSAAGGFTQAPGGGAGGVQTRKRISRANFPRAIWLWLGSILGSILGFWPRPSTAAPWGRRGTLSHTLLVVVSSLRAWNAKTVHPRSFNFSPLCRSQLPLVAAFDSEPVPQPNWLRETDPQKHYIAS